ncbi:TonB family protein [Methylobacterium sp. W2]|uniref:energy transducer TonB family protein n=1 Tax=Methylobacterium sp. W2 TaxID=2598107 RepID=UPI001D0C4D70|nr:TonB family protein [Methylobacterium sp. W2]MCC0804812.1 TonB family protein [Methylobacterium sp. W2]
MTNRSIHSLRASVTRALGGLVVICALNSQALGQNERKFFVSMSEYKSTLAKTLAFRLNNTGYRYPFGGTVLLVFVVNRSGVVEKAEIKQTSGSRYLDTLALDLVRPGTSFLPFPDGSPVKNLMATAPLHFRPRH